MIKFLDGPAAGMVLMVRRAPLYLRAVQSAKGAWDALDQFGDMPRKGETVHVYLRTGEPGSIHINAGKSSGWFATAEYRLAPVQPELRAARLTLEWQAWCREQVKAAEPKPPVNS